ncbi:hypothetical protein FHS78_002642 [Parvibaculum indicum]|uniref:hypothetical protein n=1 Tax=Parvibaculum indicum TaxID=562969 RepID=UPI00141E6990|nr:hypothetical protein [Parvibaculum indicum]NIJ42348.1 hypothetical protein [Parvibaculum indicum]
MKLQQIPLKELSVNNANDRHGELLDEDKAIEWLLSKHAAQMRKLTADIVKESTIYELPLVHKHGAGFTVYDGNRRITCLKLLADPQKSPTTDWATFFTNERLKWDGSFPNSIGCQVETDLERIDEILYRRHTGSQGGVGQTQWNPEAKSNFERRTGKHARINLAEEVETLLHTKGALAEKARIPRSNFNRLFSSETFRNRVGVSVRGNKLKITHDEAKVISALSRVVQDMTRKGDERLTLEKIWSNAGKRTYLDDLEREGMLPSAHDARPAEPIKVEKAREPNKATQDRPATPAERKHLIRNIDYGVEATPEIQRALDIWNELQFELQFGRHDNAIAVLFRLLLEFSIEHYIKAATLSTVFPNDKLKKKFQKVLDDLEKKGDLDFSEKKNLEKFTQSDPIISSTTLNTYVHDPNFFPSDQHLKSMWDTLSKFIVICLNAAKP